ncbi:hypothetical protein RTBOTA2_000405 [Rhodotorula toruloides]|nr:hypothetical protein RTBOTA2_000405 [Rhodotorula toruloides]
MSWMPYVDSHGRVHSTPPLLSRIFLALRNLWLALCLFVATLLNPNATHADRPSSSLAERERRRRDAGSSRGGGGGLGRTTGARIGGLGGSPTVNVNTGGGCCGGLGGVQM